MSWREWEANGSYAGGEDAEMSVEGTPNQGHVFPF
jgi:hypothetical protein